MGIREAIARVVARQDLTQEEAAAAMEDIVSGAATPAQIAALVVGLRMKGETVEEVAGLARVMRRVATRVPIDVRAVDTCGTGGDGASTFNISTVAALVVAGAGVPVAKHGNRAVTSGCGSADLLEALGVPIDLPPDGVVRCVREAGFGFMFAPRYHPAMKHAMGVRREVGVRTVFNILGPLTNPAGVEAQLLGVAMPGLGETLARVLGLLGVRRAMVVHSEEGLDEISLAAPTTAWEVVDGEVRTFQVCPEDVGLLRCRREDLRGGDVAVNRSLAERVLQGERGPTRDVVLLNAAAALRVAGAVDSLRDGVQLAAESVDSGRAYRVVETLRRLGHALGAGAGH